MKVLITGGAGFLGYHLAGYLSNKNLEVALCDIAGFEKSDYPNNSVFYNVDVRDDEKVTRLVKGVDVVIHAAAALPLWKESEIISTNLEGTRNILKASFGNGVKRVIYISSTAVYGIPIKHPISENDVMIGVGPYGKSKIAAEEVCLEYIEKGLNVTIIRPKTFLGPGRLGVFQILYDWVKSGKRIPILGNGHNRYQLLAVEDLTEAIYKFSISEGKETNGAFNIGAEIFGTVKDDVGALCQYANNNSRLFTLPATPIKMVLRLLESLSLSPLYRWVYETADKDSFVSIDKIKRAINYQPKFSNSQTLISSYQWYLNNYKEIEGRSGVTHRVAWKQGALGLVKHFF